MAVKRSTKKATSRPKRVQGVSKRARSEAAKRGWKTRARKVEAAKRARSEAAKRGWKTRARKVEAALKDVAARWGEALEYYRDTGDFRALRKVDAERSRIIEVAEKSARWRHIVSRIAGQAAEMFDIEEDTFVR